MRARTTAKARERGASASSFRSAHGDERRVLKSRVDDPGIDDFERSGIVRSKRRLLENAQVGGLALDLPVVAREGERFAGVPLNFQLEARLFALMERVAAGTRGVEASREIRTVSVERGPHVGQG